MSDALDYLKMTIREFLHKPSLRTSAYSLKYYSDWRKHIAAGRNSVDDQMPWMAFSAIDYLKKIIRPDMKVFEYGSGGSTLFWASKVQQVISLEHDKEWFEKMQQVLITRQIGNVAYLLKEAQPDPAFQQKDYRNPDHYLSGDKNYTGKNFEAYVKTIDQYPDASFDIVVVDGRARPSCIKQGMKKLKPGGNLIVDNSERGYYLAPFQFDVKEWEVKTFGGPIPYLRHHSDTTFLQKKPNFAPQTTRR